MDTSYTSRPIGRFATALAATLLPAPALAQSTIMQPASFGNSYGKTEAILGGAPSRLAAILAEQQGLAAPKPLAPPRCSPPR